MKNKRWVVETPVLRYFDWKRVFQLESSSAVGGYPDTFTVGYNFLSLMFDMSDVVDRGVVVAWRISLKFSSHPSKQSVPVRVKSFGTLSGLRWKKESSHRKYSFLGNQFEDWLGEQEPFCNLERDESIIAHVSMYVHSE